MSLPLSDAELAALRAEFEATLPDTCVIHRVTQADNSAGGYSETPVNETVACAVTIGNVALSLREVAAGGPVLPVAPFVVRLPAATVIDANDRITHAGRTLEVTAVMGPKSNEILRRVACRQIGSVSNG